MSPLRLRPLDVVIKSGSITRATFSTAHRRCAEKATPSATSVFNDLAKSFSEPNEPQSSSRKSPRSPTGPVSIPARRGGLKNPASSRDGHSRLTRLINQATARQEQRLQKAQAGTGGVSSTTINTLEKDEQSKALTRQIKRKWKAGDIYAPHDLSWQEQSRWAKNERPKYDVFDITNFNPLDHYKNFSVLSEFVTPLGLILPRKETGLRPVNQRRIAKAIRRAVGTGMMPSVYKHPEFLQRSVQRAEERQASWIKL